MIQSDKRFTPRRNPSDWIVFSFAGRPDVDFACELLELAYHANRGALRFRPLQDLISSLN
jgi:hypothetical protein